MARHLLALLLLLPALLPAQQVQLLSDSLDPTPPIIPTALVVVEPFSPRQAELYKAAQVLADSLRYALGTNCNAMQFGQQGSGYVQTIINRRMLEEQADVAVILSATAHTGRRRLEAATLRVACYDYRLAVPFAVLIYRVEGFEKADEIPDKHLGATWQLWAHHVLADLRARYLLPAP